MSQELYPPVIVATLKPNQERRAIVTAQEERRLPLSRLLNPPEPISSEDTRRQERLKNLFRYYGIPIFSTTAQDWIRSHCQPSNTLSNLSSLSLPWINRRDKPVFTLQQQIPSDLETKAVCLPDRFITEACVALYKCGRTGLLYPLVDADALTNIIKTAYSSRDTQQPRVITARAFVFSFVAFCSSASHSEEMTFPVDGENYASTARQLLHAVESGPPSLEALQTTVFLVSLNPLWCAIWPRQRRSNIRFKVFYHCFEGCLWAVRGVLRVASHLVKDLAPGMGFFHPPSSDSDTIFRNLFWICFLIDKELFLRLGETPLLPAELCVPPKQAESPFDYLLRLLPCFPGVYTSTFHLSILMSKIYSELYAPEAVGKSDIAILRTIRALDDELEEWRLAIPKDIRPTIHASNQPTHLRNDADVLILHLKFHNCLGCIHQAVSRCQTWAGEAGPVKEALRSSLTLSTQASAASLELLRANPITLNRECFWCVIPPFNPIRHCWWTYHFLGYFLSIPYPLF